MMKCLICERNENQVMLMKLPLEAIYENANLVIMGNVVENEFMCLPCIGVQFDESFERYLAYDYNQP